MKWLRCLWNKSTKLRRHNFYLCKCPLCCWRTRFLHSSVDVSGNIHPNECYFRMIAKWHPWLHPTRISQRPGRAFIRTDSRLFGHRSIDELHLNEYMCIPGLFIGRTHPRPPVMGVRFIFGNSKLPSVRSCRGFTCCLLGNGWTYFSFVTK